MSNRADYLLARTRYLLSGSELTERGYGELISTFRELDAHLSAGGAPPEAWREGPDADLGPVGPNGEPWGWQGSDNTPPPPEGLSVFAHWSAVHDGINVEVNAPEGLHLTVHVNDCMAVDHTVGDYIPEGWPAFIESDADYPEGYYPHDYETPDCDHDACDYCGQASTHRLHKSDVR